MERTRLMCSQLMKQYRDSSVGFFSHLKISKQNGIKGFEFSVHKIKALIELPLHLEQSAA